MKNILIALLLLVSATSWAQQPETQLILGVLKDAKIIIHKSLRRLEVQSDSKLLKTYPIALGFEPLGTKLKEGDGKTPEGEYVVVYKNPKSQFYLSLGLNYPNKEDGERGFNAGLIDKAEKKKIDRAAKLEAMPPQGTALGGEIFIHGGGIGLDWTLGCVALRNEDIKELFSAVPIGTAVSIKP